MIPLLYLFFPLAPTLAAETPVSRFRYSQNENESLVLQVGRYSARTDLLVDDSLEHSIIFDGETNPAAIYMFDGQEAIRLTAPALNRVAAHLNIRYEEMRRQLDEAFGEMSDELKQELVSDLPNVDPINLDSQPEVTFHSIEKIAWQNRTAKAGELLVDGEKRGSAVLLEKAPVTLEEQQQKTLVNFQQLLNSWIEIVRRQPEFTGGENPYEETQNLILDYFPRLAHFSESVEIKLVDWEQQSTGQRPFELPEGVPVQPVDRGLFD